jgi:hypothetical protein
MGNNAASNQHLIWFLGTAYYLHDWLLI